MSALGAGPLAVARFRGAVSCSASPALPFFWLSGLTPEGEPLMLTFAGRAPQGLPGTLQSPGVEHVDGEAYLIREGERQWPVVASSVHLHRELPSFYSVIEPQVPPWRRRFLWRVLLGIAARPAGLALLRRLRGG